MNEYGLDVNYFKEKLSLILRDIGCYKPEEMHRELSRLAEVVAPTQKEPVRTKLHPMPTEENPRQWYFDCDDLYIDVAHFEGEVSIFVNNRIDGSVGWKELIEKQQEPKIIFKHYDAFSMAVEQVSKEREELRRSFDTKKETNNE